MTRFLSLLLGLSLGCTQADGFVTHVESTCVLADDGTPVDFMFCVSFNKDVLTCWDSQQTMMVPCEYGMLFGLATNLSDMLNRMDSLLQYLSGGLKNCASRSFWGQLTQRTRPPTVQVAKTTPFNTREPVMLACYVSGFYPEDVTISWRKNGEVVTPENNPHNIVHPNGDWTYQTVSYLATNPSFGDTYICVVEHASSPEPILEYWTPWPSPMKIVKISVAVVTLCLGLLLFSLGFLGWRRSNSSGYTYVPVSH